MDLIKEAIERYPIGTRFKSASKIYEGVCTVLITPQWSNHYFTICAGGMGILYDGDTDTWAEII